jgi:hypothetical protein
MKHLGQDSIQQCLQTKDKVVYQHGFIYTKLKTFQ